MIQAASRTRSIEEPAIDMAGSLFLSPPVHARRGAVSSRSVDNAGRASARFRVRMLMASRQEHTTQ